MGLTSKKFGNSAFWVNNLTGERQSKVPVKLRAAREWSYWDSELEWKVYQELRTRFPASAVQRQVEIELIPQSVHFPRTMWCVDFAVSVIEAECVINWHYIEAKGEWILHDSNALTGFTRLIKTLAHHNPGIYSRLHLVSYKDIQLSDGIMALDYHGINERIK